MPCLDTLVLVAWVQHCKHDTIIHTCECTLNALLVTFVNMTNPLVLAMVYCPIAILLTLLGTKLQLILLALGLCQRHMVLWNAVLSLALTLPPTLSKLHESLRSLATMSLLVLSTHVFPVILNP